MRRPLRRPAFVLAVLFFAALLTLAACQRGAATRAAPTSPAGLSAQASPPAAPPLAAASAEATRRATAAAGATTAGPPPTARPVTPMPAMRHGDVNLAHLNYLTEPSSFGGREVGLVHIYSEYPKYEWVDAAGEGIAALDDVARAALVYLAYYERAHDELALGQARLLLNFVTYVQADDGEYYNFVLDRSGTINRDGSTSYKSWGWWAARGQWALAAGYRVFRERDATYAKDLQDHYLRGETALAAQVQKPGAYNQLHGIQVPAWFLGQGSDVSALAMLGLAEYYSAAPNDRTKGLLTSLGDAVAAYHLGGPADYPFGAHPSTATSTALWHAWGSHQCHALARAGQMLGKPEWVAQARAEADTFFAHLLASDFLNQMAVMPERTGQIAYGAEIMTSCFQALASATGSDTYRKYAGLAAAWFYGNNMARFPMYDPATGRGFDGIQGPSEFRVNRNAGAESTIEALYALLQVVDDPAAARYLHYRPVSADPPYRIAEAEEGRPVPGKPPPDYGRRDWTGEAAISGGHYYALPVGSRVQLTVTFPAEGDYYLYAAHMRQAVPQPAPLAEVMQSPGPISLDGDLGEWGAAAPLRVDSRENIVRGASEWDGPESGSFTGYFLWDNQNLYIAAAVRAPSHQQTHTGADVWRGDVLWVYLDTRHEGTLVDRKFTLAQTPEGPQVWDWKGGGFVPGARMAWKATAEGYNYEAAIPWKSLYVDNPAAGKVMGVEVGRGFGGSGFQDLGGKDPDTASNLIPLKLVTALTPTPGPAGGQSQQAGGVALRVELTDSRSGTPLTWTMQESIAPDRDYLWLDRLGDQPFRHAAGDALLSFEATGTDPGRKSLVDAFLIQPVVERKQLADPAGHGLTVVHSLATGETKLEEGAP